MVERKRLDFTPDKRILRTISKTGHSFKAAFSEMIDNSLDSFKSVESQVEQDYVTVSIQFAMKGQEGRFLYKNSLGEDYDIEIWDDAGGMDENAFKKCLKLAYVNEKQQSNSIRRYGVGLKTSLLSLGSKFKIMSRPIGSKKMYVLEYDDKKFVEDEKANWDSIFFEIREEEDKEFPEHGTVIKIKKNEDLKIYPVKISQMRTAFSIQYDRFLKKDDNTKRELKLIINRKEVIPESKELITFEGKDRHHFEFDLSSGKKINGWFGFYPKGRKKGQVQGQFGFDLIWRRRIITTHSKIGIRTHPEYQRIYGDIHLDELEVDFHKTSFIEDSNDYVDFKSHMEFFLNGPEYDDAKENLEKENKKTIIQLEQEKKQFLPLKRFLDCVKESRKLREKIKQLIELIHKDDILPIPLSQLNDLTERIANEAIPLDNIPKQDIIIDEIIKDVEEQHRKRIEHNRHETSDTAQTDIEETENQPTDQEKQQLFYKKADKKEFDIKIVVDAAGNVVSLEDTDNIIKWNQ